MMAVNGACQKGDIFNVSLAVENKVPGIKPSLNYTIQMKFECGEKLIDIMDRAAKEHSNFSFKTKLFPKYGKYITEMDGLKDDKEKNLFWMIYSRDENGDTLLKTGVSTYIPDNGEQVVFKYKEVDDSDAAACPKIP